MSDRKDNRYGKIFTDPKFWDVPRQKKRMKIDKRFKHMFADKKFQTRAAPVDSRGRSAISSFQNKKRSDIEKFYDVSDSESDYDKSQMSGSESISVGDFANDEKGQRLELNDKQEDDSEDTAEDEKSIDESEATNRLAICNQDWDRIRAIDLFMLFMSFTPPEKSNNIRTVTIYQSDFGASRKPIDEAEGPRELRRASKKTLGDEDIRESLVKYQRNRLKYCYAVAEFDSPSTALTLYRELDGLEYEDSCTKLDLRFIPNSTSFLERKVISSVDLDEVKRTINYEPPPGFVTTALGQTTVKLTWEEEQTPQRKRALENLHKINSDNSDSVIDEDYSLLAPPSESEDSNASREITASDSESGKEDQFSKYRNLLLEAIGDGHSQSEDESHMEVSWDPGLGGGYSGEESEHTIRKAKKPTLVDDTKEIDDQEINAFKMMFGESSKESKTLEIEGTEDPRFTEFLSKPEFHRERDVKGKKRKKKTVLPKKRKVSSKKYNR